MNTLRAANPTVAHLPHWFDPLEMLHFQDLHPNTELTAESSARIYSACVRAWIRVHISSINALISLRDSGAAPFDGPAAVETFVSTFPRSVFENGAV